MIEKPKRPKKIPNQDNKQPQSIQELIRRYDLDNTKIYDYLDTLILEINNQYKQSLELVYPIGSIYMSVNNTNPSTWLGGEWEEWGTGKVPVGVDINDTEFNEVEKTGGSKTTDNFYLQGQNFGGLQGGETGGEYRGRVWVSPSSLTNTGNAAGSFPQNIMQPYITCYMWKRIS